MVSCQTSSSEAFWQHVAQLMILSFLKYSGGVQNIIFSLAPLSQSPLLDPPPQLSSLSSLSFMNLFNALALKVFKYHFNLMIPEPFSLMMSPLRSRKPALHLYLDMY